MSKGEVERIWLPFVPWLLIACALLPERWRRPAWRSRWWSRSSSSTCSSPAGELSHRRLRIRQADQFAADPPARQTAVGSSSCGSVANSAVRHEPAAGHARKRGGGELRDALRRVRCVGGEAELGGGQGRARRRRGGRRRRGTRRSPRARGPPAAAASSSATSRIETGVPGADVVRRARLGGRVGHGVDREQVGAGDVVRRARSRASGHRPRRRAVPRPRSSEDRKIAATPEYGVSRGMPGP